MPFLVFGALLTARAQVESREEALQCLGPGTVPHDHANEPASHSVVSPSRDGDGSLSWHLCDTPNYSVSAGSLLHTVPCWGYVFREKDQPGSLDLEKLMASPLGSKRMGPWLAALKQGATVEGVTREDVCGPTLVGRKLVVLGDTCDASGVAHLAQNANLLVHEVTMRDIHKLKARPLLLLVFLAHAAGPGLSQGPLDASHGRAVCGLHQRHGLGRDALWRGD